MGGIVLSGLRRTFAAAPGTVDATKVAGIQLFL
jgi:hypothetical protein